MLVGSPVRESLLENEGKGQSPALSSAEAKNDETIGIRNFSLFESTPSNSYSHNRRNEKGQEQRHLEFPKNLIVTSRYTIFSFLPKSLFEQFRRLANVYFLVIGVIAVIGEYAKIFPTSLTPAGILGPMILVIFISITKEAIEDIKRHHEDAKVNARIARCVDENGDVVQCKWKDLTVGSVLLMFGNEELPADCITLLCGGIQGGICYVETAAIDGETNLKIRNPAIISNAHNVRVPQDKQRVLGLNNLNVQVSAEAPNGSIHRFNGSIDYVDGNSQSIDFAGSSMMYDAAHGISNDSSHMTRNALSSKHLLLRGSVLRATEWCLCVVTYTGRDTKLSLNSKSTPSKLSSVDRIVNKTLLIAISGMLVVCVISMISNMAWTSMNSDAHYLCIFQSDEINGVECDSSAPNSVLTIFTFATLYNNFVCISMYVSLEMVYLFQSYFISNDITLYDQSTDTPASVHNSGMCADLGQVQYVLSDKTGTLTQNLMKLRRVCVLNRVFGEPIVIPGMQQDYRRGREETLYNTSFADTSMSSSQNSDSDNDYSWSDIHDMANINSKTLGSLQDQNRIVEDLLRVFTACNTVLLMPDVKTGQLDVQNSKDLERVLQAESPDEVALVMAAADYGNVLLQQRDNKKIQVMGLKTNGRLESDISCNMTILAVNEFESNRKRMSIVVKCEDGRLLLLCKGADSTMLPRCDLHPQTSDFCIRQIEKFASTGLRTLVLSRREISQQELKKFMTSYEIASSSLTHREELLAKCADEIEKDMELLGAVGIEDKLQDGVPESIATLQNMGLNVWMITGDKPETAIAISKISSLLRPEHQIERIVELVGEPLQKRLAALVELLRELKKKTAVAAAASLERKASEVQLHSVIWNDQGRDHEAYYSQAMNNSGSFHPVKSGEKSISSDKSLSIDIDSLALVIDGVSLEAIWLSKTLINVFTDIVRNVKTVVACRVSPLQKATLVRMVKRDPSRPVTLAIGDGANDVGMIHEAKVGVGISGREGKHAANSSDFAIGQFRFLVPLLMEHGRFNYIRCSKLVLYSFFKNLVLVSTLFYYCIYSGFSGTIPIDSLVIGGYNFYLGVPIVILGVFDFDIPRMSVYRFPYLAYATGRKGELLNITTMGRYCFLAFLEGMILFAVLVRYIGGTVHPKPGVSDDEKLDIEGIGLNAPDGQGGGIYVDGFLLLSCIVLSMTTKVIFMGYTANWVSAICLILSIAGFYFFNVVYGQIPQLDWYHVTEFSLQLQEYWMAIFVIIVIITEMDYTVECFFSIVYPTSRDHLVMHLERAENNVGAVDKPIYERGSRYSGDWIVRD